MSFRSGSFHNYWLTRVQALAWQESITSTKSVLCLANRECNDTTVGLCFPDLIHQICLFNRKGNLTRALAHMFLIGLQFQNSGQGFVEPTPCLTSALTLCLVTGLCTHVSVCASIRDWVGPPWVCFLCCVALSVSLTHLLLPQGADEKTSEAWFIWAKVSLMNWWTHSETQRRSGCRRGWLKKEGEGEEEVGGKMYRGEEKRRGK